MESQTSSPRRRSRRALVCITWVVKIALAQNCSAKRILLAIGALLHAKIVPRHCVIAGSMRVGMPAFRSQKAEWGDGEQLAIPRLGTSAVVGVSWREFVLALTAASA
ncbi:hypothetical protein HDV57DRAFT_478525 [Trichoderma longibrachiatum]